MDLVSIFHFQNCESWPVYFVFMLQILSATMTPTCNATAFVRPPERCYLSYLACTYDLRSYVDVQSCIIWDRLQPHLTERTRYTTFHTGRIGSFLVVIICIFLLLTLEPSSSVGILVTASVDLASQGIATAFSLRSTVELRHLCFHCVSRFHDSAVHCEHDESVENGSHLRNKAKSRTFSPLRS